MDTLNYLIPRAIWILTWCYIIGLLVYDNVVDRGVGRGRSLSWLFIAWIGLAILNHVVTDWRLAGLTIAFAADFYFFCIAFVFWRPVLQPDPILGNAPAWAREPAGHPLGRLARMRGRYKVLCVAVLTVTGILGSLLVPSTSGAAQTRQPQDRLAWLNDHHVSIIVQDAGPDHWLHVELGKGGQHGLKSTQGVSLQSQAFSFSAGLSQVDDVQVSQDERCDSATYVALSGRIAKAQTYSGPVDIPGNGTKAADTWFLSVVYSAQHPACDFLNVSITLQGANPFFVPFSAGSIRSVTIS